MSARSIVRSVTRAHAYTLLLSGVLTAVVADAAAMSVLVDQDDDAALALARTLGSELSDHREESSESLSELVVHEEEEQRWFHREVEVWRDGLHRLGPAGEPGSLAAFSEAPDGCASERVASRWSRVCVARLEGAPAAVVVASPLWAIAEAGMPILLIVGLTAVLSALLLALVGRWAILRALSPLGEFQESLSEHDGRPHTPLAKVDFGAEEIDRLAAAFNDLLERVATVFEREQRFVANAAHELRTPLTRLRGQLELAAAELAEGGEPSERLTLAIRSTEDLARSVESLLALSRSEASADEPVDLGEIARRLGDDARVRVVEEAHMVVRGDGELLTLAMRNLVDNALKYAGSDVRVVVRESNGRVEMSVEDDGPGIAEGDVDRVREPFVRGESKQGVRGSGLGLALVDHVAQLHGGRLELRPRTPRGLEAVISIPASRMAASDA